MFADISKTLHAPLGQPFLWLLIAGVGVLFATRRLGKGGFAKGIGAMLPMFLTGVVFSASLYVIFSREFSAIDKHWAYAAVGGLAGFWLGAGR